MTSAEQAMAAMSELDQRLKAIETIADLTTGEPRNLVEIEIMTASGTELVWLPIDMDASTDM